MLLQRSPSGALVPTCAQAEEDTMANNKAVTKMRVFLISILLGQISHSSSVGDDLDAQRSSGDISADR